MKRRHKYLMLILMVLSLGFVVGDDCEFEIDGWGWPHYIYDEVIIYEPYPVYYEVYPGPFFFW